MALLLILPVLEAPLGVFAQDAEQINPSLTRLLRWLDDVQLHTPGYGDPPATEVGSWSRSQLDTLVGDIRRLSVFQRRARESGLGRLATLDLYGRRLTRDDVEKMFDGNRTLIRGAVLHADVAVFVGRLLLDAITPTPAGNAGALLWYRATSAFLLRDRYLGEAPDHLNRGLQIFPDDPSLLLDSGYLNEKFSSTAIQAAVQEMRATGGNPGVGSRRAQLERAERSFRQVLRVEPGHADARLRLGHTLSELAEHEEAAAELRKAIAGNLKGNQLYFAELFLGREEEALGNRADAKRHFENAAELYPKAQSPRLALSQLARRSGDRAGAIRALQGVTSLRSTPLNDAARTDPWWEYYEVHADDTEPLMEQMRALAGTNVP
jgi:tetratricopeptide (TPR) repeat protein